MHRILAMQKSKPDICLRKKWQKHFCETVTNVRNLTLKLKVAISFIVNAVLRCVTSVNNRSLAMHISMYPEPGGCTWTFCKLAFDQNRSILILYFTENFFIVDARRILTTSLTIREGYVTLQRKKQKRFWTNIQTSEETLKGWCKDYQPIVSLDLDLILEFQTMIFIENNN